MASDAATALAAHRLHASMNICTGCDWRPVTLAVASLRSQHEAHLAAVLEAEVIRPREREAWLRGMRTGVSRAMRKMSDEPSLPLPAESDNPFADEGGEDRG